MEKRTLSEICHIRTGYQGTRDPGETYQLINLTNLDVNGLIDFNNIKTFSTEKMDGKYLLKKGEILFKKSQSSQYAAGIFSEGPDNLVPSIHFFILSINEKSKDIVIPEYVAWYLGEDVVRKYFQSIAAGMVTATIKKSDLATLEIKIPPIDVQRKLIKIQRLALEERKIMEEFIYLREQQIKNALTNLVWQE
ncbi:restriction endonuclease subunit S [Bacillus sp. FSL E2-0195]|uniref:restriction endonuclease subunit S n=1 Tax=Bacillus sp. FSL E2-0195 TaxID=2921363 RepID=UPI0030F683B7